MIRVNVLSQGRFHMLDLARELDKNGFDVKFYSFVPNSIIIKFGLRKECSVSLFNVILPFILLEKFIPSLYWVKIKVQDYIMGLFMRKCDVCISLTGFTYAPLKAQCRGAKIIMERGSKHILEQKKILERNPHVGACVIPKRNIIYNQKAYKFADFISVASKHVMESFIKHNIPENKLFVNPYGVDLSDFYPMPAVEKRYDVIMVGGWSYRKGCDLITEAIEKTKYSFLHVGGKVDMNFPCHERFTHIDAVDQKQLVNYYNQAKIFLFPSREDGFGMVLSQAVACNLPIAGSVDCGAPDLKEMVAMLEYITIIKDYTVESVIDAIEEALANYENQNGVVYAGDAIKNLTWETYGKRYAEFLHKISS